MIVPMKKYIFLAHHSDYVDFLDRLRKLGVLHVEYRSVEPSEELQENLELQKDLQETLKALRHRIVEDQKRPPLKIGDGLELLRGYQQLTEEHEQLRQALNAVEKEITFVKPWGDFSTNSLQELQQAGLHVRFFIMPEKKFEPAWERQFPIEIINRLSPNVYFVAVNPAGEELDIEAEEIAPPKKSLSELRNHRSRLKNRLDGIDNRLDQMVQEGQPALEAALRKVRSETQLLGVVESTRREAEDSLMLLEGFVPLPKEQDLLALCEEQEVTFLTETPKPEDKPPVLLNNSKFTKLFEPIGALFSLPNYAEIDLTPFFAPFFMLFFGFCLGDAGYGIVVLLAASIYKYWAKSEWKPVLTLAQFLGLATILFGIVTGTVFGINLLEDQYDFLGRFRAVMLNSDQVFQLALILGLVQIMFGLFLQAFNKTKQFGFSYAISTYGWIILLVSLLDVALLELATPYSGYAAWLGVAMILLLNDPKANILTRIGKGIWDLYGLTGIFGDLLSYIRLFALGIASAILGFVVNDIALQMRDGIPYLGPVLFVLFLVVGHGANLLIASLGAFVHPMRLTFVEFYKNAGFTGGGKVYEPFAKEE